MKGQVILKNLQWLGRHNPAFPPGSVQTAVAELLNPTGSILPYSGRLCLDKPAIVCTGTKYFNIDAGKTKNVNFQILMPTTEGTYPVHLDIFSNDELLEAYRAAEDVVVGLLKYTLEIAIEPPGAGYVTKSPVRATYSAGEVVTLTAHPYSGYEFDHWGGWPPYPGVGSTSPSIQITMDADWWVVAAFREAPVTTVTVRLKNQPSRATEWQLTLYDWNKTRIASKYAIAITDPAVFEIPPVAIFPLRMEMLIYHNSTIDYRKQSVGTVFPFPPEWYVKAFIPDYGNYYYNVSTERFEKI